MSRASRMMCVLLGAVLCLPRSATAQSQALATTFVLGVASGHGGEFGDRGALAFGIAVAHGTGVAHATSVGVSVDLIGAPRDDICHLRPDGRCLGAFPDLTAVGVEVGRSVRLVGRVDAEWFGVMGAGWFAGPKMRALLVGGGVRVVGSLSARVALVASVRGLAFPNTSAGALWVVPVTMGLRLR
ncbi:MAG: hypothetical protein ACYC3L_14685 [Gemmatimonadaceae bacterium]